MLLSIDFGSDQPIYMQIRDGIVAGIASGQLQDGDPLPSVRTLGSDIGVNLHTVNKSYRLLQSEGFIEIQRSRGTFVKAGDAAKNAANFLQESGNLMHAFVSEAITRNVDRAVIHRMIDHIYDELEGKKS
ncbi:GntR family transcriptional regulator [Sporolactobacillus pectinivorans]|uniref:GntR family transcriptional regulator n=1 Tax=Sporolactobacillus pectinivorans TaxID=1591408 RepID=UPI000C256B95|nr:GntR family transcriptional regulator [Sporolactobacillus pectinivorans]